MTQRTEPHDRLMDLESDVNTDATVLPLPTGSFPAPVVGSSAGHEHDPDAALCVHDVTVAYDRKPVLWGIDFDVPRGTLTAIVGPNGSGKTTLMRACLGLVQTASGTVRILGRPYRDVRRNVAFVPQRESVDWDFPVRVIDVVMMGRLPMLGWLRRPSSADRRAVDEAMDRTGISDLADRQIGRLSGGQQQRVFLARALAQEAEIYFMDEPFAAVDAATERTILDLLRDLRGQGRTVIVVHHDLQTVRAAFDRVVLLNTYLVASGTIAEAFTAENIARAYGGRLTLLSEAGEALAAPEKGTQ